MDYYGSMKRFPHLALASLLALAGPGALHAQPGQTEVAVASPMDGELFYQNGKPVIA